MRWDGRQYLISDLGSTNGTYVNGERIQEAPLTENARVQIGPFHFTFTQGALRQQHDTIRVDAVQVNQEVAGGKLLLKNVSFSILPKEFVCIVGGSGAGKSTLLDAISGVRPASHGTVLYNGVDYYGSLDEFRSLIGYVPQDDIVPTQLTVRQALSFAGQLRLPPDARPEDIKARVDDALDLMELTERADLDIHRLSGGQRKRVSIGVELLTDPTLFFLDEPTSGLDPGLETRMMKLMRKVADRGKTVILVTHATQNVTLCDKVIFMAPGGYLAYFGPPTRGAGVLRRRDLRGYLRAARPDEQPGRTGRVGANVLDLRVSGAVRGRPDHPRDPRAGATATHPAAARHSARPEAAAGAGDQPVQDAHAPLHRHDPQRPAVSDDHAGASADHRSVALHRLQPQVPSPWISCATRSGRYASI